MIVSAQCCSRNRASVADLLALAQPQRVKDIRADSIRSIIAS